jgi:hypothetical protein
MSLAVSQLSQGSRRSLHSRMLKKTRVTLPTLLVLLNVPHNRKRPFFLHNGGELEYISKDFARAARRALADAHPDNGGNTREFQNLSHNIAAGRRSLAQRGRATPARWTDEQDREYHKSYYRRWTVAYSIYAGLIWLMKKDAKKS